MKLKYYGTAAAEGVPGLFCDCEVCTKSRQAGGRNIRTRSQASIDGKILIDFPADTYLHALQHDLRLFQFHTLLITHNHSDHLYPADFEMRYDGFAHFEGDCLTVYGTQPTFEAVMQAVHKYHLEEKNRVDCKRIRAFAPFSADGYTIVPLKANHDFRCEPLIYLVEKGGKTILYAHDTGYFPEETWDYLKENKIKIDLASLDCTTLLQDGWNGHMGIPAMLAARNELESIGAAKENMITVVNHFSHNGGLTYDETVEKMKEHNILVSYDGMEIEI